MRRDLGAVIEALEITDVVLRAPGIGIIAALSYIIDHPDRVAALVLDGAIA